MKTKHQALKLTLDEIRAYIFRWRHEEEEIYLRWLQMRRDMSWNNEPPPDCALIDPQEIIREFNRSL